MGGQASKLQEELERTRKQLSDVQSQAAAREAELHARVLSQEASLLQRDQQLANASRDCAAQLDEKQKLLQRANKQREIAEEMRRSDALLVKRVTSALLRREAGTLAPTPSADGLLSGSMAAELAVATDSGLRLHQALQQSIAQLEASNMRAQELEHNLRNVLRGELCHSLWMPTHFDVSLSLRSAPLMVLGGLRFPRQQHPGHPATGLSGGVGVLRTFQIPAISQDGFGALGGSILWDARERELAALRLAFFVQPSPTQQLCASFDHLGKLNLSAKGSMDAFSVRVSGSIDANQQRAASAAVEFSYDLD
mmetsp:Transcript_14413/g.32941  ORF Transcript_14413/g.32941 Transcript_14413/m.32941 type:complete len:310 (-) Transcript_14413:796-1725(-)|eukprot:CAMPEP_0119373902 /NCGR_PEP_ID=MMETSP1334-20130426/27905_1 /TAXON_ID=127549 /ORGANISM="Calcidiscus leptoporus, Strain RCC1130" /LENGTH=309 /DNA_ID=CAMNT_0007391799 /DNA_START=56 /DNA_END=985 /DNA_ORIENTATION=-